MGHLHNNNNIVIIIIIRYNCVLGKVELDNCAKIHLTCIFGQKVQEIF